MAKKEQGTIWDDANVLLSELYKHKGELYEAAVSMIEDQDISIMLLSGGIDEKEAEIKKLKREIAELKKELTCSTNAKRI